MEKSPEKVFRDDFDFEKQFDLVQQVPLVCVSGLCLCSLSLSLVCVSGLCLWCVSLVCVSALCPWSVSLVCVSGLRL